MTALDLPCIHHAPFLIINTVALKRHLEDTSLPTLTTFSPSTLNKPQGYSSLKMDNFDTDTFEWQLDRVFGM